jgi:predicted metal-binding protein
MELVEYTDSSGRRITYERYSRRMTLSAFEHGDRFKLLCEGCPKHGKNLSCPPHSPSFLAHVKSDKEAQVVCIRLPQEYFNELPPQERYHACFRQASRLLLVALKECQEKGHPIAGSGPCLTCERCSLEEGVDACGNPEERTYSLESLGVDVIGLLKKSFDLDLEWNTPEKNGNFVSAVGAAFFP